MTAAAELRRQLDEGWVFGAGCFDPLSARLAEFVGFRALHVTGFGVEASQLGAPDIGLITMPELASHVARISDAVSIPAIVDVDTGFGGVNNVARTVRELQRSGAGGIHIEDQVFPKRCPVLEGREVLTEELAIGRVTAAVEARTDPDFVIVGRSDADVISFDEVVRRCNLYLEAGADIAMPMTGGLSDGKYRELPPEEQMTILKRLVAEIDGPVLGLNIPTGYTIEHMRDAGYTAFILPVLSINAAVGAMLSALREALVNGTAAEYFEAHPPELGAGLGLMEILGLDEYLERDKRLGGR